MVDKSTRVSLSSTPEVAEIPHLLAIQKDAFNWLLGNEVWQENVAKSKAETPKKYIKEISGLEEVFKKVFPIENNSKTLSLDFVKYFTEEPEYTWRECKEKGYTYKMTCYASLELKNKEIGQGIVQTIPILDLPLMTEYGTFIINGVERVIISQIVRSPGIYFEQNTDKTSDSKYYSARIIPSRGTWLEFEYDRRNNIHVRIDKRRKQPVVGFLKALGLDEAILRDEFKNYPDMLAMLDTDNLATTDEAVLDLYKRLRPGEPATKLAGDDLVYNFFFNPRRYDFDPVGRYKTNEKFGLNNKLSDTTIKPMDIIRTLQYLMALKAGEHEITFINGKEQIKRIVALDDIDDFSNRRVRNCGELLQNQIRLGLMKVERTVLERMSIQSIDAMGPKTLVNIAPLNKQIKDFFASSQLSQFMDQNNPIAGLTNKRRLSALGPGGLQRDRAAMEVRDVHSSHYGRMCPIESPEGQNIGLIGSLASHAKINEFGFIETPYRIVKKGKATKEVVYLTAAQERGHVIAQANQELKADGSFATKKVLARDKFGAAIDADPSEIEYMDVSPKQLVSAATALIPFLEHDDANRALMGTNMQRQAVPLIYASEPLVGTGIEKKIAIDSGAVVVNEKAGIVSAVDGRKIVVDNNDNSTSQYDLIKFDRANQTTSNNQRPIVDVGEKVEAGEVIADGPATENGELALGQNLLVAFMSWEGYNFEDAIIVSERLVQDDELSSIHIEEHIVDARETKLGEERITRDIPNASESALANLDERGIIRIGAEVSAGDILVGKVTPKGESQLTPQEKLLRSIFGESQQEFRDNSLKVPHGEGGVVVDVKEQVRGDDSELSVGVNHVVRVYIAQFRKITQGDKLSGRHGNKGVISRILPVEDMPFMPDGTPIDIILNPLGVPGRMNVGQVLEIHLAMLAKLGWDVSKSKLKDKKWQDEIPDEAKVLKPGTPVSVPAFDSISSDAIHGLLSAHLGDTIDLDEDGKVTLFDGRTGEPFPNKISVGYMYILKLHHLVEDKIHARSTGPYSRTTQQPLGGKAQFGGQRFGEMEVWALEAYGAAHTLNELMTIKSDDTTGRVKAYSAIVHGRNIPQPSIPESFRVLVKEMQSLGLNVSVLSQDNENIDLIDIDDDDQAAQLGIRLGDRPDLTSRQTDEFDRTQDQDAGFERKE